MKIKFIKNLHLATWTLGKNLTPNGVFEKVVLCNLDRRPDRMLHATRQCEKVGITFERISGIDGSDHNWRRTLDFKTKEDGFVNPYAAAAMNQTMRHLLQRAMQEKWESFLFIEDDVVFSDHFSQRFEDIKYIPDDWRIIHFGDSYPPIDNKFPWLRGSIHKITQHLHHTHFIAFRNTVFNDYYQGLLANRELTADIIKSINMSFCGYVLNPPIAFNGSLEKLNMVTSDAKA